MDARKAIAVALAAGVVIGAVVGLSTGLQDAPVRVIDTDPPAAEPPKPKPIPFRTVLPRPERPKSKSKSKSKAKAKGEKRPPADGDVASHQAALQQLLLDLQIDVRNCMEPGSVALRVEVSLDDRGPIRVQTVGGERPSEVERDCLADLVWDAEWPPSPGEGISKVQFPIPAQPE